MEKSQILWNGVKVNITYKPNYFGNFSNSANQLIHIDVNADQPIPITETGYKSIFLYKEEVESHGGAKDYIESLLDEYSTSKDWLEYNKSKEQMCLF